MKRICWAVVIVFASSMVAFGQARTNLNGVWSTETSPDLIASPYVLELKTAGGRLAGTIRQSEGPQPGPVALSDVKVTGKQVSFKAKSPDGDRTVTFVGQLDGDSILFKRQVDVRDGGSPGGPGLFGVAGAPMITMKRQAASATTRTSPRH